MPKTKADFLSRDFYDRDTVRVARDLLGCFLIRRIDQKITRARIVETEAYHGEDDQACHTARGRTPRTEIMYGAAGHAYVYLVYGMYHCLNVVTGPRDFPAAVLIRAIMVDSVPFRQTDGPGKLCRFLTIDRAMNGAGLTRRGKLWIERGTLQPDEKIIAAPRVGIDYAKHCKDYLWRFRIKKDRPDARTQTGREVKHIDGEGLVHADSKMKPSPREQSASLIIFPTSSRQEL